MTELLLSPPFRRLDSGTDWKAALKFVQKNYKDDVARRAAPALEKMNELRKSVAACCQGKQAPTEAVIETQFREYARLIAAAQLHLPLCTGEIKGLTFCWLDAIDGKQRNSANCNMELVGLVMNMAAGYAAAAANQASLRSADGIKEAFKQFGVAAGLYQYAPSLTAKLGTNEVVGDVSPAALSVLSQFCLATGHHCSYMTAEIEMRNKYAVLSKLAMEASRQYGALEIPFRALGMPGKTVDYSKYCAVAAGVFAARASMHLAQDARAKDIGVSIARLREADAALASCAMHAQGNVSFANWLGSVADTLRKQLDEAQKENDTVYFNKIPKGLPAPDPLGRCMAKSTPPDGLLALPKDVPDPFKEIVPLHVASIAADYRMKMNAHVVDLSTWLQSHRDHIRSSISHLGIAAAIDQTERGDKKQGRVPDSIRNKIIALRTSKEGNSFKLIDVLVNMLGHVANSAAAVEGTADKIDGELSAEEAQDLECCKSYGEKVWHSLRQPSSKLPDFQSLKKIIVELKGSLQATVVEPAEKIKSVLQENLRDLSRLDWPMEDLDALMPFSKTKQARELSKQVLLAVEKLKAALERFDALEAEENAIRAQLNDLLLTDRITQSLSCVPPEKHPEVLDSVTAEFETRTQALRGVAAQADQLLLSCQEVMLSMAELKSDDPVADEVQKFCSSLEAACNLYQSLHRQLGDVSTTAAGLNDRADSNLSIAKSYAMGRTVEAQDFKESLDAELASKMKAVELQRADSEEIRQSKERQLELQKQIAALELQRNVATVSASLAQPQKAPEPQRPALTQPVDAFSPEPRRDVLEDLFPSNNRNGAQPYVYQPVPGGPGGTNSRTPGTGTTLAPQPTAAAAPRPPPPPTTAPNSVPPQANYATQQSSYQAPYPASQPYYQPPPTYHPSASTGQHTSNAAQAPTYSATPAPTYSNAQAPAYSNAQAPAPYSNAPAPAPYSNAPAPAYSNAQAPAYSNAQAPAYSNAQAPAPYYYSAAPAAGAAGHGPAAGSYASYPSQQPQQQVPPGYYAAYPDARYPPPRQEQVSAPYVPPFGPPK